MALIAGAPEATEPPTQAEPAPPLRSDAATKVIATLAVIAALWWGQRFLIPLTAGLMLAMLVLPLTVRLTRLLRSTVAATVLTLMIVMGALAAGAMAFGGQIVRVANRAPDMISMVAQQVADGAPRLDSALTRAHDSLQELDRAADHLLTSGPQGPRARRAAAARQASAATPDDSISAGAAVALRESAVTGSGVLLGFAGNLSIIFFIAFFVLIGGKPLTERFLDLWSHHPATHEHAQRALRECARQIRLYGGMLLITNTVIGVVVWIAFSVADLPDAAGWGATAAILHVVPYLGIALLTVLGAAETYLAHETVAAALGMAAFLMLLSAIIGTLVTAWLQGRAAKMNSAAVFIGLVFWGALWGVWGLFLGPALVVLLKVGAEHSSGGLRLAKLMQG